MTLYLGINKIAGESYRNIGEIIQSTIPLTDAGLHLLDGGVIQRGSYTAFVDYISSLVSSYPDLFTTESNWQQSVNDYGVCGKFVYNSTNNTVRLPKITGFTEGTIDPTVLGNLTEAGLPNITGSFTNENTAEVGDTGAFYKDSASRRNGRSGNDNYNDWNYFDASRSNPIYGNSDTVQPQAIKVLYYIAIATSTKTDIQVDIDEIATDLNNKVNTDLSNINASQTAKETIIGWSMPDFTAGVSINFDSSMDYIAPCDGFIHLKGNTVAADLYAPNGGGEVKAEYWFSQSYGSTCNPITKGYRCKYRSGSSSYSACIFYPLKGVNND